MSLLLLHQGDPTVKNKDHKTALDLACEFGRCKVRSRDGNQSINRLDKYGGKGQNSWEWRSEVVRLFIIILPC